ncbi:MAG TPA: glycosyltransferase family 4 protein [Thermohalobaculum sp.]|nr:glycosyltransferase family 4 protein [Thermohalobaculum sp.]
MAKALDSVAAIAGRTGANGGAAGARLLFVVNDLDFFLSHRLAIAEAAAAEGWEVHVAAPGAADDARLCAAGLRPHALRLARHGTNPLAEAASLAGMYRLFRRLRPDLVHLVTIKPVVYGGIAARLARVPAVVSAISGLGYVFLQGGARARTLRWAVRPLYRLALGHPRQRVIFQNEDDRSALEALGARLDGRSELIRGSGVDLDAFVPTPEPEGPVRVLMPARILTDKGVREFVEAARILRREGVEARFAVAGDAPAGNPARVPGQTLAAWRTAGTVELLGFCSDMPRQLAASHIVVLPSYREGFPLALVEAAAAARPVVTTDVPGCRDAIIEGETGLLVPVRDSAALARAIRRLVEEPETRWRMGRAGRALAERAFSVRDVAQRHLAIYRALLARER